MNLPGWSMPLLILVAVVAVLWGLGRKLLMYNRMLDRAARHPKDEVQWRRHWEGRPDTELEEAVRDIEHRHYPEEARRAAREILELRKRFPPQRDEDD